MYHVHPSDGITLLPQREQKQRREHCVLASQRWNCVKSLESHTPQCRVLRLCLRNLVLVKLRCPVNSTNSELGVASIVKIHRIHLEVLQGYKHSHDT